MRWMVIVSSEDGGRGLKDVMGTALAATKNNAKMTIAVAWQLENRPNIQLVDVAKKHTGRLP